MTLRLRGSTSGYAEIDAPAVAGDVTLTLPTTTGTINVKDASGNTEVGTGVTFGNPGANIFTINNTGGERLRIAADGTVSIPGALNVSGVLTYEDVTSVDAIGLSTFRDGLNTKDVGLNAISSTDINDDTVNAVDVFIYDTSKDSDGGEWRKRTSHTSWYNETLNTSTRGSRREFPAVAVIVATTNDVTIYDGDDPDLPMWMIFQSGSSGNAWEDYYLGRGSAFGTYQNTTIAMINGSLFVGKNASGGNYVEATSTINFIKDNNIHRHAGGSNENRNGIANRNGTAGGYGPTISSNAIINQEVNDAAMTVLPNAPIDDTTGLPVPTIAVSTDGGISVIKDDGNVIDLSDNLGVSREFRTVMINGEDVTGFNWNNGTIQRFFNALALSADSSLDMKYNYTIGGGGGSTENISATLRNTSSSDILLEKGSTVKDFYAATTNGLSMYNDGEDRTFTENTFSITDSSVAYATTSYNTGWMHGDIKGAFLSDTTVETFSPTNLVTEDFSANWTEASGGTHSVSSGQLTITNGGTNGRAQSNTFATTSGKKYAFIVKTVSNSSASYRLEVRGPETVTEGTTDGQTLVSYFNGTGNSSTYVELYAIGTSGSSATYEDAYVVEIEEDRSVNNNGLQVYGTITKSPVAGSGDTAAELVGYSGFSASNKLIQPYNSDLDFGTGDFSITMWFKHEPDGSGTAYYLFDRADTDGSNRFGSYYIPSSNRIDFYFPSQTLNSNGLVPSLKEWSHLAFVREGSIGYLYVNGNLIKTQTGLVEDLTGDGTAELKIGSRFNGAEPLTIGSMALFRISASAPSATQIKKMYEDEKVLFQENAACTLYGSSDAVTALAYDEVTERLHVGTSSGRSDFQGLRRINNTTTAVTTAISAHDSFILEE